MCVCVRAHMCGCVCLFFFDFILHFQYFIHSLAILKFCDCLTSLHFSVSCIGEGNGNPLQCSCLENPRDRGAWWAAVSGVAQSRTQLKRLSSSRRYLSVRVSVCLCLFTRVDVSSDLISLLSFPPISPRRWPEYPEVHVSCYLCSVQWLYSGSPFIDIWWPLTAGQVSRPSRR